VKPSPAEAEQLLAAYSLVDLASSTAAVCRALLRCSATRATGLIEDGRVLDLGSSYSRVLYSLVRIVEMQIVRLVDCRRVERVRYG